MEDGQYSPVVRHRQSKLNFHVKTAGRRNQRCQEKQINIRIFEKNNNCVEKMDDASAKTLILTRQMFS